MTRQINTAKTRMHAQRAISNGDVWRATLSGFRITIHFCASPALGGNRIEWSAYPKQPKGGAKTYGVSKTVFDALQEIQTMADRKDLRP